MAERRRILGSAEPGVWPSLVLLDVPNNAWWNLHSGSLPLCIACQQITMNITLEHGPAFALACVQPASGESIRAESGAMVSMSTTVEFETKTLRGAQGRRAQVRQASSLGRQEQLAAPAALRPSVVPF